MPFNLLFIQQLPPTFIESSAKVGHMAWALDSQYEFNLLFLVAHQTSLNFPTKVGLMPYDFQLDLAQKAHKKVHNRPLVQESLILSDLLQEREETELLLAHTHCKFTPCDIWHEGLCRAEVYIYEIFSNQFKLSPMAATVSLCVSSLCLSFKSCPVHHFSRFLVLPLWGK